MSRWFKCDLQVATPAWDFKRPTDWAGDLDHPDSAMRAQNREAFADLYMAALKQRGIEVIALADHHTGAWIEVMAAAGRRAGVFVFPGVEVTTGTGSDGVHLLLIGDLNKTERDIEILLARTCGFDEDSPPLNPSTGRPAPSPRTIKEILDDLPPGWLAVAPHAFNDNGIASKKTVQGTARWQALHHDNLSAIDVGDISSNRADRAWNQRFRTRDLDDFPCLERLAFVSTSDAYSVDRLGMRFTWIRMAEPSMEGLRQAFLDYDARIICDWDERLGRYPERNPNLVTHPWLESVALGGTLGNSRRGLNLEFSPGLNVLIGGRGAGKSTVVSAIRRIYGDTTSLPDKVKTDLDEFNRRIFAEAELAAIHHLPVSGETQTAQWSASLGRTTHRGSTTTLTSFPVRVFSQKELYERVTPDSDDPYTASRHLLSLIDEALDASGDGRRTDFMTELTKAENACHLLVTQHLQMEQELQQRTELHARVNELARQVAHLDNPATQERRRANEAVLNEHERLEATAGELERSIDEIRNAVERALPAAESAGQDNPHRELLVTIRSNLRNALLTALSESASRTADARLSRREGDWAARVQQARDDDTEYQAELSELGVDPEQYFALREELTTVRQRLDALEALAEQSRGHTTLIANSWQALALVHGRRTQRRLRFIDDVGTRSKTLRFHLIPLSDWLGWARTIREILNLRSDGYIEEVRALARWLWTGPAASREERLELWRTALISNHYTALLGRINEDTAERIRPAWWSKLGKLDRIVRIRVATTVADDVLTMRFLKNNGDPERDGDWHDVLHGSPGQRSAAMLSFVLHQGTEPLILDQPEDDLDTTLISELIVTQLRESRWKRQLIVITHNPNIPVLGNADRIIVLESAEDCIRVKATGRPHVGPIDLPEVRVDVQNVMEGGVHAFIRRGQQYSNEVSSYRQAVAQLMSRSSQSAGHTPPGSGPQQV
ncbi:TrlF family AAA-like ATPase [Nonomuraea phyllanthi]|uniref:TrlF family AAA-like ATPase n=1 Tax=Nonomuraea phyllanthi TaxID=2219224 RepID=UPI001884F6B8|nr:AAA family ATPase [Nonomuraea phyllanthi]